MLSRWRSRVRWDLARPVLIGLAAIVVVYILFFWHLGSLTSGLSPSESAARSESQSLSGIFKNPVSAPHKLAQHAFIAIGYHGATSMRLVSVLFGLLFLACLLYILSYLFGNLIGVLGTLILAATPWFILLARSASPHIMLLSPIVAVAGWLWFTSASSRMKSIAWIVFIITASFVLYAPGAIWLLALGLFFCRRQLHRSLNELGLWVIVSSIIVFIFLIGPLVWNAALSPSLSRALLLIPAHGAPAYDSLKSLLWSFESLVWRTQTHHDLIIGRLPLMDALQVGLLFFGLFAMLRRASREGLFLITIILIAILAAGFDRSLGPLSIAMPALAIFVAAGLRYLYAEWMSVFPKNPLPRGLAIILIVLLAGIQLAYGIRYSLIAWPRAAATKSVYVLK